MRDPIVTVILTSYNQAEWLVQAVDSVVGQTLEEWELLLVDNASTDETELVLRSYEGSNPRIRVVRQPRNRPHTMVLNEAVRLAKGKYLSLLFADDYYLPRKLERQVAAMEILPEAFGVTYCSGYRLRPHGRLELDPCGRHEGDVLEAILKEPAFFLPIAPLVRRECFEDFPFDETIFMEGEGIYAKIALRYSFHSMAEPLVVMREHERNLGKDIESNMRRSVIMYERLFGRPDFRPELLHLRGQAIGGTYQMAGWQLMRRAREYRKGREWLWLAIRNQPKALTKPRVLLGLVLGILPRWLADRAMDVLDRLLGKPPPPLNVEPLPVNAIEG